ncbi:MAG: hypothetical protein BalsKO_22460 [Balneolaceae bacterium]
MDSFVENYISVLKLLTYVGVFNGFLFTVILATKKNSNRKANIFFILILLVLAFRLTEVSLLISGELWRVPILAGLTYPLLFLIGPLFFLYTKRLWVSTYQLEWIHLLMLIPLAWAIWDSWEWLVSDLEWKAGILKDFEPWLPQEINIIQFIKFGVMIVHTSIYLIFVIKDLNWYKESIYNSSSNNNDEIKLSWLRKVTMALFIYVVGFFITMIVLVSTSTYGLVVDRTWVVVYSFLIHAVGIVAIQQPHFFSSELNAIYIEGKDGEATNDKYKNSPLEHTKASEYFDQLTNLMEEEKLFLSHELKASDVAEKLGIPSYQLSHLLSLKSEYSFFDFINNYRIEEAKRLLSNPDNDHLTILAIGMDAGFNNKSSFNRAFKKFTGDTPSRYKLQRILDFVE